MLILIIGIEQTSLVYPPFVHTMGINRGTLSYMKLITGKTIDLKNPDVIFGIKFDFLDDPNTNSDDDEPTLFLIHTGDSKIYYNIGLTNYGVYEVGEKKEGRLWNPTGIVGLKNGSVFVVDRMNSRIVKFRFDGKKLDYIGSFGNFGILQGCFDMPYDISITEKNEIYVSDEGNNRVQVFDTNGVFLMEIKGFTKPRGIFARSSYDSYYKDKRDYLYVIDDDNKRINLLTTYGDLILSLNYIDIGFKDACFERIALDSYGTVYITDSKNHCIHIFKENLKYLTSFGRKGKNSAEFIMPKGITILKRFNQIFIQDSWSIQYFWIGLDIWIKDIRPYNFKPGSGTTIYYFTTQPARVNIDIYNEKDELVNKFYRTIYEEQGDHYIVWAGDYNDGRLVPPGKYKIVITGKPLSYSRRYLEKKIEAEVICTE